MKGRLLVLTDRDIYGLPPCGGIHAICTLLERLTIDWQIDIYCLHHYAAQSGHERIRVIPAEAIGKKRLTVYMDQHLDNLLIRFLRRGFNRVFEAMILWWRQRRRPIVASFYNERRLAKFKKFVTGRKYDVVVVEYLNNTYLLEALKGQPILKMLDMHDVMHLRSESFAQEGIYHPLHMDKESEYTLLREYDYLLAIQAKEAAYLHKDFGGSVITVPRPHPVVDCPFPPIGVDAMTVLFFASKAIFNLHAYDWFVENVWPSLHESEITLLVAGTLCDVIGKPRAKGIRHIGYVERPEQAYSQCHVTINPVRIGSGLKIKNIEALAHGRSMITSSLGTAGLEGAVGRGLIVADAPEAICKSILSLKDNPDQILELGKSAQAYIAENFSPDACFSDLDAVLSRIKSS